MTDKDYANLIAKSFKRLIEPMVNHPENIELKCFKESGQFKIELRVHFADHGKILGKGFEKVNFTALSTIMKLIGEKSSQDIYLKHPMSPNVGNSELRSQYIPNENCNTEVIQNNLRVVLGQILSDDFEIKPTEFKDESHWKIIISKQEKISIAPGQLAFHLSKIFHAIGRKEGRKIYITAEVC